MVVFGIGSLASALIDTPNQLIGTRALMGIGGAFIMPATLSIITNVFPPEERGRAIGMWAAIAGVATALGPISGGFLLEHFYWGSIFLVNLPIVAIALGAGAYLVPTSKDPSNPRLDPIGALLSIVGLVALVYAIIEAPEHGWTDPRDARRLRRRGRRARCRSRSGSRARQPDARHVVLPQPALQRRQRRHHAAVLRDVRLDLPADAVPAVRDGLQPARSGRPAAADGAHDARHRPEQLPARRPLRHQARRRHRARRSPASRSSCMAGYPASDVSYWGDVGWRLVIFAVGMGLTMGPATESIMGSLPRAKAGVGSAMNDTTRQVGGALGVAIVGSVMSSSYGTRIGDALGDAGAPAQAVEAAKDGLGQALQVIGRAPLSADVAAQLVDEAKEAFVSALHRGMLVAAAAAIIASVVTFRFLPARGTDEHDAPPPA